MTGVIYARYSSDSQREESIEGQLRECMAYAERSGITIIGNYIDRAMSARTADRPDFQRMINDSEKHLFDVILVWKLDRFSRDRYDSATYKHILKKNGVKVISATENISDSPEGILLESLLEGLSEYYSAELSVKIQRGQIENAMKGKNNGGTVPLGLRKGPDGVMELDPITAPIVQEVFQRYDKGESMTDIVASLNERGIRTAKGLPFRIGSLSTVLKNRKYIGEYRYGKIVIPDKLPVIIDVELFDRVQRRMEVNRHAPARAKADAEYLLTTKLFCGYCGRMLAGESGRSRNGEVHYYYKCGGAKRKQGCTLKAVKKRWIERTVVTATIARVLHDDVINRIADALVAYQAKESTLLPSLKQQLRECEKSIQNMLNAIEAGIITPSTKQRLQDLEARREELNVSILQEQLQKPRFTKEQIVAWISRFKYGDPDDLAYQKQIIDTFVNSVYVYDDRLVMTYNYKDGTETISLDAVHQAFGSDLGSDAPPTSQSVMTGFFLSLMVFYGKQHRIVRTIFRRFLEGAMPTIIARELNAAEIPFPSRKGLLNKDEIEAARARKKTTHWSPSTLESILTNEKYKGDAILQKTYCTDYIRKTFVVNDGSEIPKYYAQNSHPAIVSAEVFDLTQMELEWSRILKGSYSGKSCFASRIICGDCGSFYGSKVWHSTGSYRRVIWRCNSKYDGEIKCSTPYVTQEELEKAFVSVMQRILQEKAEILAACHAALDTAEFDWAAKRLEEQLLGIAERVQKLVEENARMQMNQEEYQQKYNALADAYEKASEKLQRIAGQKQSKADRRRRIEVFLQMLEQQEECLDFDPYTFVALVDKVVVSKDKKLVFCLRNGMEYA